MKDDGGLASEKTLLDEFAGLAMQGLLAGQAGKECEDCLAEPHCASMAYHQADAMIAEKRKRERAETAKPEPESPLVALRAEVEERHTRLCENYAANLPEMDAGWKTRGLGEIEAVLGILELIDARLAGEGDHARP